MLLIFGPCLRRPAHSRASDSTPVHAIELCRRVGFPHFPLVRQRLPLQLDLSIQRSERVACPEHHHGRHDGLRLSRTPTQLSISMTQDRVAFNTAAAWWRGSHRKAVLLARSHLGLHRLSAKRDE